MKAREKYQDIIQMIDDSLPFWEKWKTDNDADKKLKASWLKKAEEILAEVKRRD